MEIPATQGEEGADVGREEVKPTQVHVKEHRIY